MVEIKLYAGRGDVFTWTRKDIGMSLTLDEEHDLMTRSSNLDN